MLSKQARKIFKQSVDRSRKNMIAQFIAIGMKAGSASTYYHRFVNEQAAYDKTMEAFNGMKDLVK